VVKKTKIKKTTIVDIAEASGVSVTTVSRILNNRPDVADETRQRVLQIIEDHGFAPQAPWQQLRSGKSRAVTLHFPQDFNSPTHDIIINAALGCEKAGYSLNLVANPLSDNDLLAIFRSGQADGMILMEILTHDPRVELLRQMEVPFVMIGRCADTSGLSYVDSDVGAGVSDAVSHLFGLGHRAIALVTIAQVKDEKEYGYTTWALQSYERSCKLFGLPRIWRAVDQKTEDVACAVNTLLAQHPEISAIVAPQDSALAGILNAVQARGLRIPDDLSLIGLLTDSVSLLTTPPMTTIGFPSRELGMEAARILTNQLSGAASGPHQVLLRPELTVRGSTGPAKV
jgi:DNA-binding LacI/PurR family transcriptional regulator